MIVFVWDLLDGDFWCRLYLVHAMVGSILSPPGDLFSVLCEWRFELDLVWRLYCVVLVRLGVNTQLTKFWQNYRISTYGGLKSKMLLIINTEQSMDNKRINFS